MKRIFRTLGCSGLTALLLVVSPTAAWADTTPSASTATSCPTVYGTTAPTGASAPTFTYNKKTCLWENAYYTWDPATKVYTPLFSTDYAYNSADGQWEYTNWIYNPATSKYEPHIVVKPAPPPATDSSSAPSGGGQAGGAAGAAAATTNNAITGTGAGSSNGANSTTNNTGNVNQNYGASLSNNLNQNAISGDANIGFNTQAGNATTGNATDVSNIINLLQSTTNLQPAAGLVTFTANINGNVNGDLLLDPNLISQTGSGSTNGANSQANNNLTVNSQGSGLINNDINVGATSGDANVTYNTQAGSATTGAANAVANIVNVLNSAVASGKSFVGTININGNLNGDILLPPNFLDQLVASGAPSTTVALTQQQANTLNANFSGNQSINNNVGLSANSGNANVLQNTQAGNATTGNATTNLTVFNLTGRQVVGSNSLMVFVNVLGKWVGLIMDAPAGANSAALCGGNCQVSNTTNNNATINDTQNNTINNNIKVNSQSGNANVVGNTIAGNAKSGDATSSVNLANISNSGFSLTDWFGLLFINVFGTWNGSFGINTAAGNPIVLPSADGSSTQGGSAGPLVAKVFAFVPKAAAGTTTGSSDSLGSQISQAVQASVSNSNSSSGQNNFFLAGSSDGQQPPTLSSGTHSNYLAVMVGVLTFMAIMSLGSLPELGRKLRRRTAYKSLQARPLQPRRKAWMRFTIF